MQSVNVSLNDLTTRCPVLPSADSCRCSQRSNDFVRDTRMGSAGVNECHEAMSRITFCYRYFHSYMDCVVLNTFVECGHSGSENNKRLEAQVDGVSTDELNREVP